MAAPKVNLNDIAKEISVYEGLKDEMTIAQIKELIRVYNEFLTIDEIIAAYYKYN